MTIPHSFSNHLLLKISLTVLSPPPSPVTTLRGACWVMKTATRLSSRIKAQNMETVRDAKFGRPSEANISITWTTSRPTEKTPLTVRLEKSQICFQLKNSRLNLTKNSPNDFLRLTFAQVSVQWLPTSKFELKSMKDNLTEITNF